MYRERSILALYTIDKSCMWVDHVVKPPEYCFSSAAVSVIIAELKENRCVHRYIHIHLHLSDIVHYTKNV